MPTNKEVISFRISEAEKLALEALQQPGDTSLGKTALRLLQGILGTSVNSVDVAPKGNIDTDMCERIQQIEEKMQAIAPSEEHIRDVVADRTAYLATAMNEVKNQLENEVEFLKIELQKLKQVQETQSHILVTTETTEESVALPQPLEQEEISPSAIAPELTEENVISPQAGKQLSKDELRTEANTIYTRLKRKGLKISATIIKEKILEMYPNSEDWISDDARLDVIRALEKQHK